MLVMVPGAGYTHCHVGEVMTLPNPPAGAVPVAQLLGRLKCEMCYLGRSFSVKASVHLSALSI